MSLSFRKVPKISRKQGRSRKWARRPHQTIHVNESLDDFPPLPRVAAERNFSVYNHKIFPVYSQGYCLSSFRQSGITHRELSNWQFLEKNHDKSFEEVRWNDYQHKDSNTGKTYSQCLIKNKFCCQRNQNPYSSKPDVSMTANKSVINILGEFKEKLSGGQNNFTTKRESSPMITAFQSNVSFNSPNLTPVMEVTPFPDTAKTYELPVTKNRSVISNVQITNRSNENQSLSTGHIPYSNSLSCMHSLSSPINIQKPTSSVNLVEKSILSDFKSTVITQRSSVNLNLQLNPTRTKSFSSLGSLDAAVNNVNTAKPVPNDEIHTKLLPKISEESSVVAIKPFKTRSIHTMNDPIKSQPIFQANISAPVNKPSFPSIIPRTQNPATNTGTIYQYHQAPQQYLHPEEQQSLFPNTTWFLQENLSNQFGFNQIFNTIQPIFDEGNLYAEYFDYPTVPSNLRQTMDSETNSIVGRRKNFRSLFSPYEKENHLLEKYHIYNSLF